MAEPPIRVDDGDKAPIGVDPIRARPAMRALLERSWLDTRDLLAPLLVHPVDLDTDALMALRRRDPRISVGLPAAGLPGVVSLSDVAATVRRWRRIGLRGVKLFGFGVPRDPRARGALEPRNVLTAAVEEVKAADPEMVVTTEVCGCTWTTGAECALLTPQGRIDRPATFELFGEMAVRHAEAGADAVSPSAMLDGSIRAVRAALDDAALHDVGVAPNIAIHTTLYGPFRAVTGTVPSRGNRRGLQLEPGRAARDAVTTANRWLAEGASMLTLQPTLTAVDVLVRLRQHIPEATLIAYSTSGEYAALHGLGPAAVTEYLASLRRAGADLILTFAAEEVATHARAD